MQLTVEPLDLLAGAPDAAGDFHTAWLISIAVGSAAASQQPTSEAAAR